MPLAQPQYGDAPSCTHALCPGYYIDDMFNDRVPCSCSCHERRRSRLPRFWHRRRRVLESEVEES